MLLCCKYNSKEIFRQRKREFFKVDLTFLLEKREKIGHNVATTTYINKIFGCSFAFCGTVGLLDGGVGLTGESEGFGHALHLFCGQGTAYLCLREVINGVAW